MTRREADDAADAPLAVSYEQTRTIEAFLSGGRLQRGEVVVEDEGRHVLRRPGTARPLVSRAQIAGEIVAGALSGGVCFDLPPATGVRCGDTRTDSPTAAEELNTSRGTPALRTASSSASDPATLVCQYHSGCRADSPAAIFAAKCRTPSNPEPGVIQPRWGAKCSAGRGAAVTGMLTAPPCAPAGWPITSRPRRLPGRAEDTAPCDRRARERRSHQEGSAAGPPVAAVSGPRPSPAFPQVDDDQPRVGSGRG